MTLHLSRRRLSGCHNFFILHLSHESFWMFLKWMKSELDSFAQMYWTFAAFGIVLALIFVYLTKNNLMFRDHHPVLPDIDSSACCASTLCSTEAHFSIINFLSISVPHCSLFSGSSLLASFLFGWIWSGQSSVKWAVSWMSGKLSALIMLRLS